MDKETKLREIKWLVQNQLTSEEMSRASAET